MANPLPRSAKVVGGTLGAAVVAAAILQVLGCQRQESAASALDRIVLVTIDTLRADHLGSYGYARPVSPFLDSLAERGIQFRRAYAHSGITQPSHASLFTSLYPLQHNVIRNGHRLDEGFLTLAEVLAGQGFTTAAFTSTDAHFEWGGLRQGFDHYDELHPKAGKRLTIKDKGPDELYRPASETVDAAVRWLRGVGAADRFFLWVHLFDPHRPFRAPFEFLNELSPKTAGQQREHVDFLRERHHLDTGADGELQQRILLYDAEIAFVDRELERLFAQLEQRRLNARSLWIVTSDHGQGLLNHGYFGHTKQIYNVQLHVPLIFYFDSETHAGTLVEDRVVEHVDIMPTLTELIGAPDALDGQLLPIQGQSLVPLIRGRGDGYTKRFAFAQTNLDRHKGRTRSALITEKNKFALQTLESKYMLYTAGDDEFYDLRSDPYETRNLIDEPSSERDELRATLESLLSLLDNKAAPLLVDEEALEKLKALGYVQ
jgi:arylsulfatase A-like enzyme